MLLFLQRFSVFFFCASLLGSCEDTYTVNYYSYDDPSDSDSSLYLHVATDRFEVDLPILMDPEDFDSLYLQFPMSDTLLRCTEKDGPNCYFDAPGIDSLFAKNDSVYLIFQCNGKVIFKPTLSRGSEEAGGGIKYNGRFPC